MLGHSAAALRLAGYEAGELRALSVELSGFRWAQREKKVAGAAEKLHSTAVGRTAVCGILSQRAESCRPEQNSRGAMSILQTEPVVT